MSSGGGSTQSTQTQSLPPWLTNAAQGYLGQAQGVAQLPYMQDPNQQVADLSPIQQYGIQGIADLAGGTPYTDAAGSMLTNTLQGNFSNPYGGNQVGSGGMYQPDQVSAGSNQFIGMNPQFQAMRSGALDDIVHNYQTAISPEITRQMNLSGNLGGSADLQARDNAQRELAQQLGRASSQMTLDEYNRSGALQDSQLARGLQAQTFNQSLGNQAYESAAQRGLQAGQFNANLGSNAYEAERNRQMGAVSGASGLYGTQLQGLQGALSAGDLERQQQQALLSSQHQNFLDYRNYPDSRIQLFGQALAPLFGGAPRDTTTNQGLPPPDRVAQGIGAIALGNSLSRGSGK